MAEQIELTPEGKQSLEEELKRLLEVEEPELLEQMSSAASQGDLRENFAYHDARRELGMLRGRIKELSQTLKHATIISKPKADGRARLGAVVVIKEVGFNEEEEYILVSEAEASKSRKDGKTALSLSSPMGAALLNKKVGEKANFNPPNGQKMVFEIVRVS